MVRQIPVNLFSAGKCWNVSESRNGMEKITEWKKITGTWMDRQMVRLLAAEQNKRSKVKLPRKFARISGYLRYGDSVCDNKMEI